MLINGAPNLAVHRPFGGFGISGVGKEGGRAGFEEFLRIKSVAVSLKQPATRWQRTEPSRAHLRSDVGQLRSLRFRHLHGTEAAPPAHPDRGISGGCLGPGSTATRECGHSTVFTTSKGSALSGPFIFIATNKLKEGKIEAERSRAADLGSFIEANEPQLLGFNEYVNEEGSEVGVVQVHPDATSMEFHMEVVGERAARAYAETLEATTSIQVYGESSERSEGRSP